MRITNPMVTNKMLLNINRNAKIVNKLYGKLSTGKEIEVPSDNPILAARALKFRINVSETQQYARNVDQGLSWMEITEKGMSNVINVMDTIRELTVRGASDIPHTAEDRKKVMEQISQLIDQLGTEMNVSYAGRYVFSGYRTDDPTVLTNDIGSTYRINQSFNIDDLDKTKSFQVIPAPNPNTSGKPPEYVVQDVNVLKLPYTDLTNFNFRINGNAVTVNSVARNTTGAYSPADTQINYIQETGELVLGKDVLTDFVAAGTSSITYEKTGFSKGELNPRVNFACTELSANPQKSYNVADHHIQYEFGANIRINVNTLGKDVYTANMFADLKDFVNSVMGVKSSTEEQLRQLYTAAPNNLAGEALDDAIRKQMLFESQQIQGFLQKKFSNALSMIDKHFSNVSVLDTDIGGRMNRLELIQSRLENDEVSYTKLLSANEDADYIDCIMSLNSSESIYQAALMSGSKIMQISLADYIR